MIAPAVARVLERLEAPRAIEGGWVARCPAHADRSPSLTVAEGEDGRALVHCFAGCDVRAIAAGLGIPVGALFADPRAPVRMARPLTDLEWALRDARQRTRRDLPRIESPASDAEAAKVAERAVAALRALATRLGDTDEAWALLEIAAAWERRAHAEDPWA